jgi:hypothetical protein
MNQRIVSAVFDSREEATRAVSELRDAGARDGSLSLITRGGEHSSADSDVDADDDGNVLRGILGGGALGAGLGVAALAIPGVGPLAAAGAIAASAVPAALGIGAAAGAAAGTLNEVLHKHGVSEEDAAYYNDRISNGGVFVSVDTAEAGISGDAVHDVLYRCGGHNATRARPETAI